MKKLIYCILLISFMMITTGIQAQKTIRVIPKEIDDVLLNPGMGFSTFQRFNGDTLNVGLKWTEGHPIEYQPFRGTLINKNHPMTTIAYFRIYWKYLEPEEGKFNWDLIDTALKTAKERNQTLMLRVAPHGPGTSDTDVPSWYRAMVGAKTEWPPVGKKWMIVPNDSIYAFYFGRLITELGKRYDGNPDLESVDLAIVGAWGEGAGANLLKDEIRKKLVNAYTDNFKKTPLLALLTDEKTNMYALSQANVGWRVDCLGDMGGFRPNYSHMEDVYPQRINNFGVKDAWEKAPVSFEVCWVMQKWKDEGWDIEYIIDQSLKWHISTFNAKSSSVPEEWVPSVNRWLKKMGYRFVLRNFSYTDLVSPNGVLKFKSWWENKGVAPCYKDFSLAFRLKSTSNEKIFITDADIKQWLPGDIIYDNSLTIPKDFPHGIYDLQVAIIDKNDKKPKVNLAIQGRDNEGWYQLGKMEVK